MENVVREYLNFSIGLMSKLEEDLLTIKNMSYKEYLKILNEGQSNNSELAIQIRRMTEDVILLAEEFHFLN